MGGTIDVVDELLKSVGAKLGHLLLEERLAVLPEPARDTQPAFRGAGRLVDDPKRIHNVMESLLRADSGEVADCVGRSVAKRMRTAVPLEVDPGIDDPDLFAGEPQVGRHRVGVHPARGDVAGEGRVVAADQFKAAPAVGLAQALEKNVVPLQHPDHRGVPLLSQFWHKSREQHVGEQHDIRLKIGREPIDQLGDFLALFAVRALKHRDGQAAEILGFGPGGKAGHPAQQPGGVQQAVEEPGRVAKQPELLLQENVDPAHEDAILRDALLVRPDRRVSWDQQGVVPEAVQGGGQRVVPHAGPAIHAGRPGGDERDLHTVSLGGPGPRAKAFA